MWVSALALVVPAALAGRKALLVLLALWLLPDLAGRKVLLVLLAPLLLCHPSVLLAQLLPPDLADPAGSRRSRSSP